MLSISRQNKLTKRSLSFVSTRLLTSASVSVVFIWLRLPRALLADSN